MEATATESRTTQDASDKYRAGYDLWMQSNGSDSDAIEAVQAMASAAYDRAKEVHTEHDRMILDLQGCVQDLAEGKLGGDRIESVEYALYLQSEHIRELQATIEDLMSGGVITKVEPEVRVRIGHTHTLKDGWRCDSTTVEWTGRGKADWELIRAELGLAHTVGEMEAQRRHAEAIAPS